MKKNDIIIIISLLPFFFLYSHFLLKHYLFGDQYYYRIFYDNVQLHGINEILNIGFLTLGASEPLSLLIIGLGSALGVHKDIWISIINCLLLALLCIFLRKHNTHWILVILILSNFYITVLLTGAERLKIAYIFLLAASISYNNKSKLYIACAALSHFQTLIFVYSLMFSKAYETCRHFSITKPIKTNSMMQILAISSFALIFIALFYYYIFGKVSHYLVYEINISELFQLSILALATTYLSQNKFKFFLVMLSFAPVILLVGGERVNMIAFSVAMYYLIQEKKQNHPIIYFIMFYFFLKSLDFKYKIYFYGDGFFVL